MRQYYWNVRKEYALQKGDEHVAKHATIMAISEWDAIYKAMTDSTVKWRKIDTWDMASGAYCNYSILGETDRYEYELKNGIKEDE